jgi:hypothetical protein
LNLDAIRATGGRKHVAQRQGFLSQLVGTAYAGTRPHLSDRSAFSISQAELNEGLRAEWSTSPKLLAPLFTFPEGNRGYSRDKGLTKPYRLRPAIRDAARDVFTGTVPLPVVCAETGKHVTWNTLPPDGFPPDVGLSFTVPSILPLTVSAVDHAIARVQHWADNIFGYDHGPLNADKPNGMTLAEAIRCLQVVRQWALSLGGLPNFYHRQRTGRMGPGNGTAPHVLSIPSVLRRLLLVSSGLHDYDLRGAHWACLSGVGKGVGFDTSTIDDYLSNRDEWHRHLSTVAQCRAPSRIKPVLLSLLNGGTLSTSPHTDNARLLGAHGMAALARDDRCKALAHEVRAGLTTWRTRVERMAVNGTKVPVNALGLALTTDDGTPPTARQENAHLLVGVEQVIMRAIAQRTPGLAALCYDGMIAPQHDTTALEAHARQTSAKLLGFPVPVSLKREAFNIPAPDPIRDAWDF